MMTAYIPSFTVMGNLSKSFLNTFYICKSNLNQPTFLEYTISKALTQTRSPLDATAFPG